MCATEQTTLHFLPIVSFHLNGKTQVVRAQPAEPTNRLLDRLPAKDRARVLAACEQVVLPLNSVLAEAGGSITDVYFPTASFVSMLTTMDGDESLEVSLAGN